MVDFKVWGTGIEDQALDQMRNACSLPVATAGALMPDAHVGYGLPIGGVLATKGAVIPYAVGVDIACRVMLSVIDLPANSLHAERQRFEKVIEQNTRFGMGAKWDRKKQHAVLDEDWNFSSVVKGMRDTAWQQLGTSGSGNHFVEFGELEVFKDEPGLPAGSYLGLVSHSGSRGSGARIADHFSKRAMSLHADLPKELLHLAWLPLDGDGAEYWQAMELMGRYASANHHLIHKDILRALGVKPIFQVETHHNFAWKETYQGEEWIVHRKGATPAGKGVLGYVPGSMSAPGYLVEGLGNVDSLESCSHGAGRTMSRNAAKKIMTSGAIKKMLREQNIHIISAGADEGPHAYKDIEQVMAAQSDLVRRMARFQPRVVKMAPDGERAED